jgi:stalled ribosome rescue protein Dom34
MKKEAGLWIDHRQAVIVILSDQEEEVKRINSNVEKAVRDSEAGHDGGGDHIDRRDRFFNNHLNSYYDEVVEYLRDADAILIMGPGEAKSEFQNRMETHGRSDLIVSIETTDNLTDDQIVAEVRRHFRESQHS